MGTAERGVSAIDIIYRDSTIDKVLFLFLSSFE